MFEVIRLIISRNVKKKKLMAKVTEEEINIQIEGIYLGPGWETQLPWRSWEQDAWLPD